LIERSCRLSADQLAEVEASLTRLDGDSGDGSALRRNMEPELLRVNDHKDWPHAPVHRLSEPGTFMVSASTLGRNHYFRGVSNLTLLEDRLLHLAKEHEVLLEAWAVFSNHYHFVAHTTGADNQLANLIARLHQESAEEINRHDGSPARQVWFNYWDTRLTFERSYLARLNYVHQNAVKHGLVRQASQYRWCSATWFERTATNAQVKTIYGFRTDRVKIDDDYEPVM
jgi:putative transposase